MAGQLLPSSCAIPVPAILLMTLAAIALATVLAAWAAFVAAVPVMFATATLCSALPMIMLGRGDRGRALSGKQQRNRADNDIHVSYSRTMAMGSFRWPSEAVCRLQVSAHQETRGFVRRAAPPRRSPISPPTPVGAARRRSLRHSALPVLTCPVRPAARMGNADSWRWSASRPMLAHPCRAASATGQVAPRRIATGSPSAGHRSIPTC